MGSNVRSGEVSARCLTDRSWPVVRIARRSRKLSLKVRAGTATSAFRSTPEMGLPARTGHRRDASCRDRWNPPAASTNPPRECPVRQVFAKLLTPCRHRAPAQWRLIGSRLIRTADRHAFQCELAFLATAPEREHANGRAGSGTCSKSTRGRSARPSRSAFGPGDSGLMACRGHTGQAAECLFAARLLWVDTTISIR